MPTEEFSHRHRGQISFVMRNDKRTLIAPINLLIHNTIPPQSRQAIPTLSNFRHQHPDIARSPEIVVGRTTKSRHGQYCPPQVRFGSGHIHMWRPSGQKPQVETSYSLFFRLKYWFVTRKVRKIICKCVSEVHFFA